MKVAVTLSLPLDLLNLILERGQTLSAAVPPPSTPPRYYTQADIEEFHRMWLRMHYILILRINTLEETAAYLYKQLNAPLPAPKPSKNTTSNLIAAVLAQAVKYRPPASPPPPPPGPLYRTEKEILAGLQQQEKLHGTIADWYKKQIHERR